MSVENIATLKSSKFISEEDFKRDYKVFPQENDILMTRIGDVGTTNVVTDNGLKAYYVSLALLKYKSTDPYFLSNAIQSDYVQKGLANRTLKTAIPMKINKDEIGKVSVMLPLSATEQQQIGTYFRNLDNLITLHQRKYSCLQNTYSWEQRELGELGEIMTGVTPSTSKPEYYSEDGIPWVTPTDINALTISDTPRKLSEEGMRVGRVVPANTILCTCIASIGKNALLTVKGSFNQQINSLAPNTKNDAYFLLTESELWSDKMKRMAASGTMQIVNKSEFAALTTMVPSIDEQKKLGTCFSNLDNLITLHQRE